MNEWSIEPRANVPPPARRAGRGLSQAIRDLNGGQAIFVPAREGETLIRCRARVSMLAIRVAHTRTDRERNGIWVFKDETVKA